MLYIIVLDEYTESYPQWPILLTWISFNRIMDK